eukprot:8352266-Pyramimonas_sp.AAC.1
MEASGGPIGARVLLGANRSYPGHGITAGATTRSRGVGHRGSGCISGASADERLSYAGRPILPRASARGWRTCCS